MRKLILLFAMIFAIQGLANAQCPPVGAINCTLSDAATNVTFGTINNPSGCGAGGYTNYPVTPTTTTNLTQGLSYPISIALQSGGGTEHVAAWIDYNASGTFDVSEFTYLGTISTATSAATLNSSIAIPTTATPGTVKMRIRVRYLTAPVATDACTSAGTFGEVEDYTVTIVSSAPCSGTPVPGNTLSNVAANSVCAGLPYTMSVQNTTAGAGVTYQWQSSSTGAAGSYTNITGATSPTFTVASASVTTWYQLRVTCASSTSTGISNPVSVTVNPLPVVAVTPTTSCGAPANALTASGANTYTWSPALGLSGTTGASVNANPTTTTTYTVTGTTTATGCINTATAVVNTAPTASVLSSPVAFTYQLNEGFDAAPVGWLVNNLSNPIGTATWGLGTATSACAPAYDGAPASHLLVNFNSGAGTADLSNWLFTPVIASIKNGDVFSFWTRAAAGGGVFPDRLEARLSTNGASTNVGTTSTSVGDFTTVLQSVNPGLTTTGYPEVWTKYTVTISGITGTVSGRIAFRYWVTNGGPSGANSNIIGLDRVQYGTPPSAVCNNTVSNLVVNVTGGVGPFTLVYSDGTNNITYPNYSSGGTINVTPPVSTTYSIVSVTGANGCVGSGNSGVVTIVVTPPATITTQPAAITNACVAGNTTISVAANTVTGTTYQWQVNTVPSPGAPVWTNITNAAPYSGATTNTLAITAATATMNNYQYRAIVTGACGGVNTSNASTLSVNTPAVITTQPVTALALCVANNSSLSVVATGNSLSYIWEVSTNSGTTWNAVTGANYSGQGTSTLTLVNVPATFLNNQYRVRVSTGGCASVTSNVTTINAVNPTPIVTISAAPVTNLFPGLTTTLTAAVSPNAAATYQWVRSGVNVVGATSNKLIVNVDGLGFYTVKVTDVNGCTSNGTTPVSITISDSVNKETLFIYPSPNTGKFQVRYYNDLSDTRNAPGYVQIFDEKGSRVFTRAYSPGAGYGSMPVDLGTHGRGVYRVDLMNSKGERIKTGSVMVF